MEFKVPKIFYNGDIDYKLHISGNDQINYGYTDKGLNQINSKDKINFSELGTQLAYIYRLTHKHKYHYLLSYDN